MNRVLYILLAAVIIIALPLFAGWVPFIGEFIPKVLIMLYVVSFAPFLMKNKAFLFLLLFYIYVILQSVALGYELDFVTWFANFMDFALPIFLLQAAIKYDNEKTVEKLAKFAIIYIFVTILLSIIVMINDPTALRQQQAMTVMGEYDMAYQYKRQGLASYGIAAMVMCMPAVLISIFKSSSNKKVKLVSVIGVALSLVFMWMGQVTTTSIICISLTFMAFFIRSNAPRSILFAAILLLLVAGFFGESIIDTITPYTEETAMGSKFANLSSQIHGGQIETEEGSIEGRSSLTALTLSVFYNNLFIGDPHGYIGGHNYFIDRLALYGIIGVVPFFLMIFSLYKMTIRYLPSNKHGIFTLIFLGFISLGLLKNMPGIDYWLFMFCFYPFILKYSIRFDGS